MDTFKPFDLRKWNLFLYHNYVDMAEGHTFATIFDLRLEEARQQIQVRNSHFPPSTYPRMLIIGPGPGTEILAGKEIGYDATGIGLICDEQYQYALSRGADFHRMDMHDIRIPNESFDVIYSHHSFEHCVHPWLVCIEMWAVLRVGGRVFIEMPEPDSGLSKNHTMVLPPEFMKKMFEASGFKTLENQRHKHLFEKISIEELQSSPIAQYSVWPQLAKRLELGREYEEGTVTDSV